MGLYYSGLIDWQYANDPIFEDDDLFGTASPTFEYADYSYKQMMELVDTYKPSVFWNDIGWPKQSEEMMPYFLAHYYNKVEDGVVNDRLTGVSMIFLLRNTNRGKLTEVKSGRCVAAWDCLLGITKMKAMIRLYQKRI